MLDVIRVPDRFEQDVCEPQRQQILDSFLAEVMIDPEDAGFAESLGYGIIDFATAGEIGS